MLMERKCCPPRYDTNRKLLWTQQYQVDNFWMFFPECSMGFLKFLWCTNIFVQPRGLPASNRRKMIQVHLGHPGCFAAITSRVWKIQGPDCWFYIYTCQVAFHCTARTLTITCRMWGLSKTSKSAHQSEQLIKINLLYITLWALRSYPLWLLESGNFEYTAGLAGACLLTMLISKAT